MSTNSDATIKISRYVTDGKGRKVGAILDMKEVERILDLLEDAADLRCVNERALEPAGDYEKYRNKRFAKHV